MSSALLGPPEEQLCVFLMRDEGGDEELEMKWREVGCQWESPEEERKEVGCQWECPGEERRDAAVQVDLPTQQLDWKHTGASPMLLQCLVRPDGPDGGPLLQHCAPNRTRTRTIQPPIKLSPTLTESRPRSQKRPPPQSPDTVEPVPDQCRRRHQRCRRSPPTDEDEEDSGDPLWTPGEGGVDSHASPSPLADVWLESDSQRAPLRTVKLEPDSTVCDVCGKVMKNKSSLARHSFIHTGMKPFACHLCNLHFNRRDNLQHHLSRMHPNGIAKLEKQREVQTWLCAVCGKTFSCRSRLKTHEVIHSGVKPYRCDLCPKAYMRTNDLEHHKKVVHVDGTAEPQRPSMLLCDLCGKEFRCKSQLAMHFQTHTGDRPHLCDICGRKFARQHQLNRHKVLVHANQESGEENLPPDAPFACDICGKRLKSEAQLAAHARSHSANRPHHCNICPRTFQRATCLKQHHIRVHLRLKEGSHTATSRKPSTASSFMCPMCGKEFKFRSLLASHSLIHSGVRPYSCDFCSRSFQRLSHLKRHREVVHANGERLPRSFICHFCGKDKKCSSQLARHIIIHTGERPFACDLCPARFNRSGNLKQHMKRMHGVGAEPVDDGPPILFDDDDDIRPALTYKQEETVVGENTEVSDEAEVAQQLDAL